MASIRLDKKTKTIKIVNRKDNVRLQRVIVGNVRLQHVGKTGPQGPQGIQGIQGPQGIQGIQGPVGPGVSAGGTAGQILAKIDATNYNTEWIDNFTSDVRHYVKNDSGTTINKGEAVYISGSSGTNVLVKKAQANSDLTSARTLGLAMSTMTPNGMGYIVAEGALTNINTSSAGAAGDPVYLSGSTPGGLIYGFANKPHAPVHLVYLGVVTRKNANTGEIFVKVQNGYELEELHDVAITSIANNQTIMYDSATSLWKNHTLVKADVGLGNVDNTSDANKPISTATQTALDGKVDENAAITPSTKTKITYDAKGLVTAGADAAIADITGLQTALDNKLDDTQLDTDGTLTANSDAKIASQKATKTYADTKVTANSAIIGATKTKITYDSKGLVTAGADAAVADITGLQTALDNKLDDTQLDTDPTLSANLDSKIASQKATKTYVDNVIGNANALVYKGTIDCSANPNYPVADSGHLYVVSVAGKIGGTSGIEVEVGDLAICNTDGTPSGNEATVGQYWNIIQKNIIGAVTGPASSVNNNVAFFDGATGKVIKDSGLTLSGSNTGDETNSTIKTKLGTSSSTTDGYLTSADWSTFNAKQNALGFTPEDVANKDTDNTLSSNSNTKYPSQKAIKSYVDTGLGTKEPAITAGTTSQYYRGDKTFQTLDATAVGLGNVTNDQQIKYSAPVLGGYLDITGYGFTIEATAGENVVSGDLCYLKSDGKYWKADRSSVTTSTGKLLLATESITADNIGTFLAYGQFTTSGLTAGYNYYVGTAGALTTTTPTTQDHVIRPVATAASTTLLEFNPSVSWATYKA